ncbi:MAG TPA: aquaporin [Verrucomicrobiae bacterium]|nr:aquaporin [Verrucomicrobiae bacterium]
MKIPWQPYLSELIGTALLVGIGLSFVIFDFGQGSPVAVILPDAGMRRLLTGFLFGATGAAIAYSRVGKVSGAHINPVVTLAFYSKGKLSGRDTLGYIPAQFAGAILGSIPLLFWGQQGRSVDFGGTTPGTGYTIWAALLGEVITTVGLIVGLFVFLGHRRLRQYTPLLFPFLYAVMVYLEAPVSGTSTNPARSLGPSVISGVWSGWWIYFAGPLIGMFIGLGLHQFSWLKRFEVEIAKIHHFNLDRYGIFKPSQVAEPREPGPEDSMRGH